MDLGLRDKVVFVTGASGGIGRAIADAFAEENALLVLHAHRNMAALEAMVEKRGWGDRAHLVEADVRESMELLGAMDSAVAAFGRVDACVANAGIWPPGDAPIHEMDEARIRDTIATNLLGAAWTARAFFSALAATGPRDDGDGSSLVFIGSTSGRFGERGHVDYSMSKSGMYGLLRTLKNEIVQLDPYGRVNLVEPGWTVTEMARPALDDPKIVTGVVKTMALRQLARAKDIARTVRFLCSPTQARHISGEVITIAGGMEGRSLWQDGDADYQEMRRRWEEEA